MHRSVAEKNNLKYRSSWIQLCGALMVDILERIMHTQVETATAPPRTHTHTQRKENYFAWHEHKCDRRA